jgi:hypothetical protein
MCVVGASCINLGAVYELWGGGPYDVPLSRSQRLLRQSVLSVGTLRQVASIRQGICVRERGAEVLGVANALKSVVFSPKRLH